MKKAVIYWSGTGNTEVMAKEIAQGMGQDTEIFSVDAFHGNIGDYEKVAFGCPSMGDEVLEEGEFEPFFSSIESDLKGKKVALFGSYGWGDGQWMRDWCTRCEKTGINLFNDGLTICGFPDADGKAQCLQLGQEFSAY
ncbi:flavodoxin domain-containing protein [Anaerotignum sp.]|uniref:flavodoxin domain-containing protein n=1 Tax=Anaerotignum sp. TaxID=2039241 RepID=UPI002714CD03|nr:flavodoxin domain-containing protein [Anaerotignum sp.]